MTAQTGLKNRRSDVGMVWDPGIPVPDGTQRVTVAAAVGAGQKFTLEADRWYYAICPDAGDVFIKLGAAEVTAVDLALNMPLIQGGRNPFYSGSYTFGAIKATASAAGYVYIVKIGGDDAIA